jgi:hypothetical protein
MIIYTPANTPQDNTRYRTPFVRITRAGVFHLSTKARELLDLDEGDKVAIGNENDEWFITKNSNGFPVRHDTSKKDNKGLLFNCTFIARQLLPEDTKSARMLIAEEPTLPQKQKLYAIITSSLKTKSKAK